MLRFWNVLQKWWLLMADLNAALVQAVESADPKLVAKVSAQIRKEDMFLYTLVRDLLEALGPHDDAADDTNARLARQRRMMKPATAMQSLAARLDSLQHWQRDGNETINAIMSGELDSRFIRPHIRGAASDYADFYSKQNAALEERLAQSAAKAKNAQATPKLFQQVALGANYNHAFRTPQVVLLVELLFGFLESINPDGPLSWLDVACGRGEIANGVDPRKFSSRDWEISGADLQAAKIEVAKHANTQGRGFFAADALELMQQRVDDGGQHHIVSMFEFLEHLDDPLKLLRQIAKMNPIFVIAGSPMEQKLNAPADHRVDPVHLWSYSRTGWEQMFAVAGLTPVYANEARAGTYVGGLDWLTMICGPRDWLRKNRLRLGGKTSDT